MANVLIERMIRACKLDPGLYSEVREQPETVIQAAAVLGISALAAGIGSIGKIGFWGIILGTMNAVIIWFIWAYIAYFIGAKVFYNPQTYANYYEFLRVVAYSSAPGVIRVLGLLPLLQGLVFLAGNIWMMISMSQALMQVLHYTDRKKALYVTVSSWLIMFLLIKFLSGVFSV